MRSLVLLTVWSLNIAGAEPTAALPPLELAPPTSHRVDAFPGACATPADTAPTCAAGDLELAWPLPGAQGEQWAVHHLVDHDPGPGVADWRGRTGAHAHAYDGHQGVDLTTPSFRSMDAGLPVLAAAAGEVVEVLDGAFDRNLACDDESWNAVVLRHDNGWTTIYGHLKQHSAAVGVGDRVERGQPLGVVGSSGCSSTVHLHLEVRDCVGAVVDPFAADLWQVQPEEDPALTVMDAVVQLGGIARVEDVRDPLPDARVVEPRQTIGVGLSTLGGREGDRVTVRLLDPRGRERTTQTLVYDRSYRHQYWWTNLRLGAKPGPWRVEITAGDEVRTHEVLVDPTARTAGYRFERRGREHLHVGASGPLLSQIAAFEERRGFRLVRLERVARGGADELHAVFRPDA